MSHRIFTVLLSIFVAIFTEASVVEIRVTPETIPKHIVVEFSGVDCETQKIAKDHEGIWYATIKAKITETKYGEASVKTVLRDPRTEKLLFNPGGTAQTEGGYIVNSVAFNPRIMDHISFEWREEQSPQYRIYLRDFYNGERCW